MGDQTARPPYHNADHRRAKDQHAELGKGAAEFGQADEQGLTGMLRLGLSMRGWHWGLGWGYGWSLYWD